MGNTWGIYLCILFVRKHNRSWDELGNVSFMCTSAKLLEMCHFYISYDSNKRLPFTFILLEKCNKICQGLIYIYIYIYIYM